MNFIEMLNFVIGLLHTFVRFLPLGFYFFAYLSSAIYKDLRAAWLLIGLIINDLIGYVYKKYAKFVPNAACAIFGKVSDKTELGFLPNGHTEIMAFVASFFYSDMYFKGGIDSVPFIFLTAMFLLTIWSRITIGCKTVKDVLYSVIVGFIRGIIYYYIIYSFYQDAEKGQLERETCDMRVGNYRCDEIKDGTVIIKHNGENATKDENVNEDLLDAEEL
jgi:hypothetical protein